MVILLNLDHDMLYTILNALSYQVKQFKHTIPNKARCSSEKTVQSFQRCVFSSCYKRQNCVTAGKSIPIWKWSIYVLTKYTSHRCLPEPHSVHSLFIPKLKKPYEDITRTSVSLATIITFLNSNQTTS